MKLSKPGFWIALVSCLLVVWLVWHDRGSVSPGPLSAVHAQDPRLSEQACEQCHAEKHSTMAAACGGCHAEITRQLESQRGLHGKLVADASRCGTCHSEHHGSEFELVDAAVFARSGIADRERFDHAGLDFDLTGAHARLACKQCHENADAVLLAQGQLRFLGKSQLCDSCHRDPHEGKLPTCAGCHGQERPFAEAPLFKHTEQFPLTGSHAGVACLKCHAKDGASSIEAAGAAQRTGSLVVRNCEACHASPHSQTFLAADTCATCHPTSAKGFARQFAVFTPEQHARSGFALAAPHDKQECEACHKTGLEFAAGHPGRKLQDCTSCHADPHRGQFAGRACLECHEQERFVPARFAVLDHELTAFPLDGKHRTTGCNDCHQKQEGVRQFAGTPLDCTGCHADAHRGAFPLAKGCQECHLPDSFADAAKGFDHARWTGFAVDGAHARGSCEACHVPLAQPDAERRSFGRIQAHAPARAGDCANCHADAHRGFFEDSRDCAQCHSTADFASPRTAFDHGARTGFALVGAHESGACTLCHAPGAAPDAAGRVFGFAQVTSERARADCRACHADPHQGSFAASKSCLDCHTQTSFRAARADFDHARWTGFALKGVHAEVGCEGCHAASAAPAAGGRRMARASGSACADCHADPHAGQFAREGRTDCARCHPSEQDFREIRFDHQSGSRFALDETHRKLDCAACHIAWPLQGGGRAVRYKPLGTLCGDCHDTRH